MGNLIYPKFKEYTLSSVIGGTAAAITAADFRWILVDSADYIYAATHAFLSDVPAIGRVAVTTASMGTRTYTNGILDGADISFATVTGDPSEALIGYIHTGTETTSRLVVYLDTGVSGLPVTPDGTTINVVWNASGIFGL